MSERSGIGTLCGPLHTKAAVEAFKAGVAAVSQQASSLVLSLLFFIFRYARVSLSLSLSLTL
jgi:hypothetical protein